MKIQTICFLFLSVIVLVLAGCGGGDNYAKVEWSGTVTLNGKPIPANTTATIMVSAGESATATHATQAEIANGRYTLKDVPQGKVFVQFSIVQEIPPTDPADVARGVRTTKSLLPKKFNGFSENADKSDSQKNFDIK